MKWLANLGVIALVLGWALASHHCRLEFIPGLQFLACISADAEDHHESSDCESDGCAALESSLYKSEDRQVTIDSTLQPTPWNYTGREQDPVCLEPPLPPPPKSPGDLLSPFLPRAILFGTISPRAPCPTS